MTSIDTSVTKTTTQGGESSMVSSKKDTDITSTETRTQSDVTTNDTSATDSSDKTVTDKTLSNKNEMKAEMKGISDELKELKLLQDKKESVKEKEAAAKKTKKRRRRRKQSRRNTDDDKTQLPRSVRRFIDRMLAKSKNKKVGNDNLSDISDDTDYDVGGQEKKSPVPFHLLTVPKSKVRLLTPTLDIETGSLNILHSYRSTMFGSVRTPVYRQFPNNHFQTGGRLKMAYTEARLPSQRAMEKLAATIFQEGKRSTASGDGVFNMYTDRMLMQSTKLGRSAGEATGQRSYLPFVIQMERSSDLSRVQTKVEPASPVQVESAPSPASNQSQTSVTTAVLSVATLTVSETTTPTNSKSPGSDQAQRETLMTIQHKYAVPRITVNKPIVRNYGVLGRPPKRDVLRMTPVQRHMLHPGTGIRGSATSTDHLLHSFLRPTAVKHTKEDYIVRKVC